MKKLDKVHQLKQIIPSVYGNILKMLLVEFENNLYST